MNSNKRNKLLGHSLLLIPISLTFIEILSLVLSKSTNSISKYVDISVYESVIIMLIAILFYLLSLTSFIFFCRPLNKRASTSRHLGEETKKITLKIFMVVFSIIAIYKVFFILNFGVLEFSIQARTGLIPVGQTLYFVLLMFPFILAYNIYHKGLNTFSKIAIIVLFFLNLATGYRSLIFWALSIITCYNWQAIVSIGKRRILFYLVLLMVLFISYEYARGALEGGGVFAKNRSLIDSFNRTKVLSFIKMIEMKDVSVPFTGIIKLWSQPFIILFGSFGVNFGSIANLNYFSEVIYEPLFSEYLVWRGTPKALPTGFAISIISHAYLHGKLLGVIIFSIFYGWFLALGIRLLESNILEKKLIGVTLITGCFYCNESVIEATKSVVYAFLFLGVFFVVMLAIQVIISSQNRIRKTNIGELSG